MKVSSRLPLISIHGNYRHRSPVQATNDDPDMPQLKTRTECDDASSSSDDESYQDDDASLSDDSLDVDDIDDPTGLYHDVRSRYVRASNLNEVLALHSAFTALHVHNVEVADASGCRTS